MAGIYIHIPFCKQACHYCDFYFTTSQRLKDDFLAALIREIDQHKAYLAHKPVQTVYYGGGTPSQLAPDELWRILEEISYTFPLAPDAEITLEANPDDLDRNKLKALKASGFNRLSIGVQSFFDEDLKWMNRAHDAEQALRCIKEAQDAGISNISMDLIYGVPGLTPERWQKNMDLVYKLGVPHLSAYSLTVENNTPLQKLISQGRYQPAKDAEASLHFEMLMERMKEQGWLHYEISNFAKDPDHISKHNSNYWKDEPYLGLGPSAHSYNGHARRWNLKGLQLYIDRINSGSPAYEEESLTLENRYNEFIMTRLRTMWGVWPELLISFFGKKYADKFLLDIKEFVARGEVEEQGGTFMLTAKGKMFADQIASSLFIV